MGSHITPHERTLYAAAKLLYAFEQETSTPTDNVFRRELDRGARATGAKDIDAVYEYWSVEFHSMAEMRDAGWE